MGVFDKAQKRKKRKIKKRVNQERAAKAELNRKMELQRHLLAILIMQDEMFFTPERYWNLLHELSGETEIPEFEFDSTEYWVVVSELRKLPTSWINYMDEKGRQWQFNTDYALRVRKQVANGEIPVVSMWLEAAAAEETVVTPTGKVLGDAVDDVQRDTDPAEEG